MKAKNNTVIGQEETCQICGKDLDAEDNIFAIPDIRVSACCRSCHTSYNKYAFTMDNDYTVQKCIKDIRATNDHIIATSVFAVATMIVAAACVMDTGWKAYGVYFSTALAAISSAAAIGFIVYRVVLARRMRHICVCIRESLRQTAAEKTAAAAAPGAGE